MADFENQNNAEVTTVEKAKVDMFLMTNQKYFPSEKMVYIKDKLYRMEESKFSLLSTLEFKDPTTMLLISLFLGSLGVDRFMLGESGMGVLKLLTGGCCGIMTIVDWFSIQRKTKERNMQELMLLV